jgi:hypothetical protein
VRDAQKTISDSERLLKSAAPASQQWKSCQQIKKLSTHVFLYEQNIWQRGNGIPDNEAASNNQDFLRARHSSNQRLKRHHANVESLSGYASTITESFRMECRWKWGHATGEKASVISLTKELWMLTHNSCQVVHLLQLLLQRDLRVLRFRNNRFKVKSSSLFTACCQTTAAPSSLISTRKDRNSKTKEYYWDIPYMGMLILLFRIIQKARKSNQCDMATWRFSIASRTGVQRGVTVNQKWRSLIWYCRKNGQIIGPPRMMCDVTMWRCDAMISLVKVARLCWQSTPQF